jgi:hypothetical protein
MIRAGLGAETPPIITGSPDPILSKASDSEQIARFHKKLKTSFKVRITVSRGKIMTADVVESCGAPVTEQEVCQWVVKKWSFEAKFTGQPVQPFDFSLNGRPPAPLHHGAIGWMLRRAPNPDIPSRFNREIGDYENLGSAGMLVQIVVKAGRIVEIRTLDSRGSKELNEYTERWIRDYWEFDPSVTNTLTLPIYYRLHP